MRKVLEAYNFGTDILTWLDILYKDPKSCVLNDGNFSKFFNLSKSCRQGDPLSPYLFILSIEPLSMEIKGNKNVKGIKLGNITLKIGQYADDTFVILDGSESSLQRFIDIFDSFKRCSGLQMNVEKTQAIWLGIKDTNPPKLCPDINLKWSQNFSLLGIIFTDNLQETIEINYDPKLKEIENVLKAYSKRYLSLIGKITVIKTLVIPKLVYLLSVLPWPGSHFIQTVEDMFCRFIWNNGKARISFIQLQKDILEGD